MEMKKNVTNKSRGESLNIDEVLNLMDNLPDEIRMATGKHQLRPASVKETAAELGTSAYKVRKLQKALKDGTYEELKSHAGRPLNKRSLSNKQLNKVVAPRVIQE